MLGYYRYKGTMRVYLYTSTVECKSLQTAFICCVLSKFSILSEGLSKFFVDIGCF